MFENGKFPTLEELLERGEHLIQKAVDGKRLSGEETYFLELQTRPHENPGTEVRHGAASVRTVCSGIR